VQIHQRQVAIAHHQPPAVPVDLMIASLMY
jgi:hypothetical protein